MQITIPPAEPKVSAWRKTITKLTGAKGGAAIEGAWLQAGDVVDVPAGTLVLAVDKVTTGFQFAYHGGERIPVQDATVAVYLAAPDDLIELWRRHYKTAKSAFGPTTMKKLANLLDQHPVPAGEIGILAEARRPNRREGQCRWCRTTVYTGLGHLVGHGEHIEIEHFQQCPTRYVTSGTPCALCGVTVTLGRSDVPAAEVMVREGTGRWETRHAERIGCMASPPESHEDYTTRLAAARQAADAARAKLAEKQLMAAERKAQRIAARKTSAEAAERAEQERVAGLIETGRSAVTLNNKGLGDGRVALDEITVSLSDGTTTIRWVVRTYSTGSGWAGEDYDPDGGQVDEYTSKAAAQAAYRALKFQPAPRERDTHGRTCDECGHGGAGFSRRDSSGIPGVVCARCNRCADYELSFA